MQRTHNELQNELRKLLIAKYGASAVKQEEDLIDLMVHLGDKTLLIEVKSSPSAVSCIREALGQILQYSWQIGLHGSNVRYVIVGSSAAAEEDIAFLEYVRRETKLSLAYCTPKTFPAIDTQPLALTSRQFSHPPSQRPF